MFKKIKGWHVALAVVAAAAFYSVVGPKDKKPSYFERPNRGSSGVLEIFYDANTNYTQDINGDGKIDSSEHYVVLRFPQLRREVGGEIYYELRSEIFQKEKIAQGELENLLSLQPGDRVLVFEQEKGTSRLGERTEQFLKQPYEIHPAGEIEFRKSGFDKRFAGWFSTNRNYFDKN